MAENELIPWINSAGEGGVRNSMQEYSGTGTNGPFEFNFAGGYIDPSHVKAYRYDPVSALTYPQTLAFVGPNQVRTSDVIPSGQFLVLYRDTPKDRPLVDYSEGAVMDEASLDKSNDQAVFIAAEMLDRFDTTNATSAEAIQRSVLAYDTANTALANSEDAQAQADNAVITAASANSKAGLAVATANAAHDTATGIDGKAQFALDNSKAAVSTSNAANGTANGIDAKATKAMNNAASAVDTANGASVNATTALSTANGIDAKATKARSDAANALTTVQQLLAKLQGIGAPNLFVDSGFTSKAGATGVLSTTHDFPCNTMWRSAYGVGGAATLTRVAAETTDPTNGQWKQRWSQTTASTGPGVWYQWVPDLMPFIGRYVTFSVYLKATGELNINTITSGIQTHARSARPAVSYTNTVNWTVTNLWRRFSVKLYCSPTGLLALPANSIGRAAFGFQIPAGWTGLLDIKSPKLEFCDPAAPDDLTGNGGYPTSYSVEPLDQVAGRVRQYYQPIDFRYDAVPSPGPYPGGRPALDYRELFIPYMGPMVGVQAGTMDRGYLRGWAFLCDFGGSEVTHQIRINDYLYQSPTYMEGTATGMIVRIPDYPEFRTMFSGRLLIDTRLVH